MSDTLMKSPQTKGAQTDNRNINSAVEALADVLNDTYRLIIKSHTYHWNVTGPLFYSIHKMTEDQYTDMFAAADMLAERIRALGKAASVNLASMADNGSDVGETRTADQMVKDLLADHESLAQRMRALVTLAEVEEDPATADLATERAAFHEKAAWMLRATAA